MKNFAFQNNTGWRHPKCRKRPKWGRPEGWDGGWGGVGIRVGGLGTIQSGSEHRGDVRKPAVVDVIGGSGQCPPPPLPLQGPVGRSAQGGVPSTPKGRFDLKIVHPGPTGMAVGGGSDPAPPPATHTGFCTLPCSPPPEAESDGRERHRGTKTQPRGSRIKQFPAVLGALTFAPLAEKKRAFGPASW